MLLYRLRVMLRHVGVVVVIALTLLRYSSSASDALGRTCLLQSSYVCRNRRRHAKVFFRRGEGFLYEEGTIEGYCTLATIMLDRPIVKAIRWRSFDFLCSFLEFAFKVVMLLSSPRPLAQDPLRQLLKTLWVPIPGLLARPTAIALFLAENGAVSVS